MYKIAKINFKSFYSETDKQIDSINNILWMFVKNGQIIEGWQVEKYNDTYLATVCIVDDDALDKKYYNKYILEELENLEMKYEIMCDDPMAVDSCHCKEHSFYILAYKDDLGSPVICGDCGTEIPLIHVPYLFNEEEHYTITNWQQIYKSVEELWIDSLSDRFTKRQIISPNSELNKRGMEICKELENRTGKPCYLLLVNPIRGLYEFSKNNKELYECPNCNGEFRFVENDAIDKVCDCCRLAFIDERN